MLIDNSGPVTFTLLDQAGDIFELPSATSDIMLLDARYLADDEIRREVNRLAAFGLISINNPPAGFPVPVATADQPVTATIPAEYHLPDASKTALGIIVDSDVPPGGSASSFDHWLYGSTGQLGPGDSLRLRLHADTPGTWANPWRIVFGTDPSTLQTVWDDTAHTATVTLVTDSDGNTLSTYNDLLALYGGTGETHTISTDSLTLTADSFLQVMMGTPPSSGDRTVDTTSFHEYVSPGYDTAPLPEPLLNMNGALKVYPTNTVYGYPPILLIQSTATAGDAIEVYDSTGALPLYVEASGRLNAEQAVLGGNSALNQHALRVNGNDAAAVVLSVKAQTGQTVPILEVLDESSASVFRVDADGSVHIKTGTTIQADL